MASWNEGEEGDNWVTYGNAFSDDESEEGRYRSLQYGKHRNVPAAYEQRVLNERGRPMRFHGAFTGGFSAGYFNTVGSKEGFKPRSFLSSRKVGQRHAEEPCVQRPEDFMDDEDFGEFGIAPRRIKMATAFDDTHVRDSLKVIFGGQSIIPESGSIVKELIIPSRGPLAERLLRKLGWRDSEPILKDDLHDPETESDTPIHSSDKFKESPSLYTRISFDAKTNTFGLGYSGLNPDVAMGRRQQLIGAIDRHPQESSTALSQRQSSLSSGFNPLGGGSMRVGIRGQAFGVGVLQVEDADIYANDQIGDYDWEIGDVSADEEEAELDAARSGRWSSTVRKSRSTGSRKYDGWTAPTTAKELSSKPDVIAGFVCSSAGRLSVDSCAARNQTIRLPPGYMPVFNPQCIRDPRASTPAQPLSVTQSLDPQSRSRLLDSSLGSGSVFDHVSPLEQLRLEAAAAGFPVPVRAGDQLQSDIVPAVLTSNSTTTVTPALLKPFKTDPHKQARFEAFQVLIRRGFTPEVAYTRCSGAVDMPGDERERELNSFMTLLRITVKPASSSVSGESTAVDPGRTNVSTPLSTLLPLHKQRLVASMLSSRFRSAGCMDISKELSEKEEKAIRAKVESLETMEPRDHAVATESYGALTRRRLTWHPDRILCKRINVPHPYPDSTFVGCPDERRPSNPFRRRRFHQFSEKNAANFSLFDLLDVNTGVESHEIDKPTSNDVEEFSSATSPPSESSKNQLSINAELERSKDSDFQPRTYNTAPVYNPNPRGAELFACLFDAAEAAAERKSKSNAQSNPEKAASGSALSEPPTLSVPRILGPSLPLKPPCTAENEEQHPPMDLFKSIFASDEELSSSDYEDNDNAASFDTATKADWMHTDVSQSSVTTAVQSFAHLFQSSSTIDTPLFALSQIASKSSEKVPTKQPAEVNAAPDPAFFHGPAPPPALDTELPELQQDNIPISASRTDEDDRIQWTDAKKAKLCEKKRKRKHGKHKHHGKRHKHRSKRADHQTDEDQNGSSTDSASSN